MRRSCIFHQALNLILFIPDRHMRRSIIRILGINSMFAFTQSNTFEYSSSKVVLYKNGKNIAKTCDICFKAIECGHLKDI